MNTLTKHATQILKHLLESKGRNLTNKEISNLTKLSPKHINSAVVYLAGCGAIETDLDTNYGEYKFNVIREGDYAESYYEHFTQEEQPREVVININTPFVENENIVVSEGDVLFRKYLSEIERLSNSFVKGSMGVSLKTEDCSYYKQLIAEITNLFDIIFGEGNKYSSSVLFAVQTEYEEMYGGYSEANILDVKAMLNVAYMIYKKENNNKYKKNTLSADQIYVDKDRIEELRKIKNNKYDLSKLIRLCEELNYARSHDSVLSITMLIRAIIDHIPPIFGYKNFNEVVNNYKSDKSFKELMERLNTSSRKIADSYLHKQIGNKEVMPNFIQVNFTTEIDVLLAEIIIILSKDTP